MKLWTRIAQAVLPDCGHAPELARLQETVARLERELSLAGADRDISAKQLVAAGRRIEDLGADLRQYLALSEQLAAQLKDRDSALDAAMSERQLMQATIDDLAEEKEELAGHVLNLEQLLREHGIDPDVTAETSPQLTFAMTEAAGESPQERGPDVVLYDKVLRLPFGLVGVMLDGDGRRSWLVSAAGRTQRVPLRDKAFLARVAKGEESFRGGDAIVVDVRTIARRRADRKVIVDYVSIDKVVHLAHADEDTPLFELPPVEECNA